MNNKRSNDFGRMGHAEAFDASFEKPADDFPLRPTNEVLIRKK